MEMKSSLSLSNARATKADAPPKIDNQSQSESSDFDRQLSQQIKQSESEGIPKKGSKLEEKQSSSNMMEPQTDADQETDINIANDFQVIDELLLQVSDSDINAAEPEAMTSDLFAALIVTEAEVEVESKAENKTGKEQMMPLAGNVLPLKAQSENLINKNQAVKNNIEDVPKPVIKNINQQPDLAEVLADDVKEKSPEIEFKAEIKSQPNNNNPQLRSGLNMANLAALSSAQQFVPQATNSAAINMQAVTATESLTGSSTSTVNSSIATPVQNSNWSQGLTEKVSWMMQGNLQTAELKLNPANLGPLEVKLSIQDDKASITFVTGHAQVKEAIDSAMPRLREMLEQQGLDLTDVDVSQYSDAKGEQAATTEEDDNMHGGLESDAELQNEVMHESMVNMNIEQGLSIFV